MKLRTALALFLIIVFCRISIAQHAGYKLYTVADGLVQSEVTAIHQDRKGFIWVGTKSGISRFDGHSFTTVCDTNGVSRAWVYKIENLDDSTVWFLTSKGCLLYSYKPYTASIVSYPVDGGFEGSWIQDGKAFFVTATQQVFQVDHHGIKMVKNALFDKIKSMSDKGWNNLTYSKHDGNFYFRTNQGKLACVTGKKIIILRSDSFGTLLTGNDDRVYFLSPDMVLLQNLYKKPTRYWENFHGLLRQPARLYRLNDTVILPVADFGMKPENMESRLLVRNADTLYYSSPSAPILKCCIRGKITEYNLPFTSIIPLLLDREQNLWLGSSLGLVRMAPLAFTHFNESDGLYKNTQFVGEDKNHCIITGGWDDGIQKLEGSRFTDIPVPAYYGSGVQWHIYPHCGNDSKGNLLISINPYCMISWNGKKLENIPGLPVAASLSFYEDRQQNTFFYGTNLGLLRQKGSVTDYAMMQISPGNKGNKVVSMLMDKTGRLLLGGFKGLSFLDGDKVTHLPTKEFPYKEGANAMVKDKRGNIWIGSTDGLWMFDMVKFRKITNPWFNEMVVSLCLIDSSKLFIGGLHGIGFLDLDVFFMKDTAVIRYFNADNGFAGNECQQNAVCYDSHGILWVATTDNLQRIDLGNLPLPLASTRVYIEKISQLDETMKLIPLVVSSVSSGWLELSHDKHNIRFDFTSPVFRGASFVKFRYWLQGQDKNWSQPTSERYAVYTNLSPGKYVFKVIACNDSGNWSASPASFEILIRPAFWQTWWFLLLFVMVLAGFFFWMGTLVMGIRKRQMQEKLESEKKIAELQLISIRNQIDPHFTFNAMNSIASVILKEEKEKAYSFFVKLSNLIRQVLTSGDKVTRTLAEELVFVQNYLEIEKLRFGDSFQFRINIIQPVNLEQEVPKMVIQTYAENALKHGLLNKKDGNGELVITIGEEGNNLHLEIEDNGIGREQARLIGQKSTGRGMMILNFYYDFFDRYNEHKIIHEVTDLFTEHNKPAGTKVTVIIPTGFNYKITANDPS
ncbi:MAG: histidine kinase [Bacteroidetes bacterium]|nr:histidine kinase [Bacteroidota bacterium]